MSSVAGRSEIKRAKMNSYLKRNLTQKQRVKARSLGLADLYLGDMAGVSVPLWAKVILYHLYAYPDSEIDWGPVRPLAQRRTICRLIVGEGLDLQNFTYKLYRNGISGCSCAAEE